ncbi:hypothetical protein BBJ29_001537 [Phytophthora kernoviae]|uniref:Uncharacterized protein n=1 Tax=Phytophthora kernoviae TaxID=325452 RepID=A0A3F2RZ28_9STRA|nr:hypothetical protein BBJ29_001537 [Phytophthora kernoviae]RLN66199.1 hypothetical protein BBP00_00002358 [Phytophthora kernoviae]
MTGKKKAGNKKAIPVGRGKKPTKQGKHEKHEKPTFVCGPFRPWESDNATPSSPSSLDVLMEWLATPGNMELWRKKDLRGKICRDIVKALQKQSIHHRPGGDVSIKIRFMEKQFIDATAWLKDNGKLEAFRRNEIDDDVLSDVLQICPQYLELLRVFEGSSVQKKEVLTSKAKRVVGDTRPQQEQTVDKAKDTEQVNGTGDSQGDNSATEDTARTDADKTNKGVVKKSSGTEVVDRIAEAGEDKSDAGEDSQYLVEGEQGGAVEDVPDVVGDQNSAKEGGDDSEGERWVVVNEKDIAANKNHNGAIEEDGGLKEGEDNQVVAEEAQSSATEMDAEEEEERYQNGVDENCDGGVDEEAEMEPEELVERSDTDEEDNFAEEAEKRIDIIEEETEEEEPREIEMEASDAQTEQEDVDDNEDKGYVDAQQEERQSDADEAMASEDLASSSSEAEDNEPEDMSKVDITTNGNSDNEDVEEQVDDDDDEEEEEEQSEREGDSDEAEPHRTQRERSNSSERPSHKTKRARADSDIRDDTQDMKRQALSQQIEDERAYRLEMFQDKRVHRHEMFRLERATLEYELKEKQMQLAVEKTLARNRLLNAGIDIAEVDRVLPL